MQINPDERRKRIMAAADADDWPTADAEIHDAITKGLAADLGSWIERADGRDKGAYAGRTVAMRAHMPGGPST